MRKVILSLILFFIFRKKQKDRQHSKPLFSELLNYGHKYFWGSSISSCIFKVLLAWDTKLKKNSELDSFSIYAHFFFTSLREWNNYASVKCFSEKSKNKQDTLLTLCSVRVNIIVSHTPQFLLHFSICYYIYSTHLFSVGIVRASKVQPWDHFLILHLQNALFWNPYKLDMLLKSVESIMCEVETISVK